MKDMKGERKEANKHDNSAEKRRFSCYTYTLYIQEF